MTTHDPVEAFAAAAAAHPPDSTQHASSANPSVKAAFLEVAAAQQLRSEGQRKEDLIWPTWAPGPVRATAGWHCPSGPPEDASRVERARDRLLHVVEAPLFKCLGVLYIVAVIADGAFFFFVMIGAHRITPQSVADWWLNASIQLLCALFTYSALLTAPWRLANAMHLASSRRSSATGRDFYGRPTEQIWFNLARRDRIKLVALLLANGGFQLCNQASRCVYSSFGLSNSWPGNLWVNVFFVLSFASGGAGAAYQYRCEAQLRRRFPHRFEADAVKETLKKVESRVESAEKQLEASYQFAAQHVKVEAGKRCGCRRTRGCLPAVLILLLLLGGTLVAVLIVLLSSRGRAFDRLVDDVDR